MIKNDINKTDERKYNIQKSKSNKNKTTKKSDKIIKKLESEMK